MDYCGSRGVEVNFSPAYAPERNSRAKYLVQEHWTLARVLMYGRQGKDMEDLLWGEAPNSANWLRNLTPSSRVQGKVTHLLWTNKLVSIIKICLYSDKLVSPTFTVNAPSLERRPCRTQNSPDLLA